MMKKILYSVGALIIISFLQYFFLKNVNFDLSLIGNIITFLSIVFGFYITSLAIFVTSRYVSDLYKIVDKNNPSLTLLHTLTRNYKFGLMLTLISLAYLISIQFFIGIDSNNQIALSSVYLIPIIGILVLNFFFCFVMLNDLVNIIIQEGKQRS